MASSKLDQQYPWIQEPLIVSAPMRPYVKHDLAVAVTLAGGLSFIPNCNETVQTRSELELASQKLKASGSEIIKNVMKQNLPVGLGYQIYQESLEEAIELIKEFKPIAVWLFAARRNEDYARWAESIREASPNSIIWIQVGTVGDALTAVKLCGRDIVLVLQGADAGGHGLQRSAGLVSFLPEAVDALRSYQIPILAAGGISEGRGAAAALLLGADGIVLGTRFLAATEASTPKGFLKHILDASDGGPATRRTRLFDNLRGTGDFPNNYDGRALINQSLLDEDLGVPENEAKEKYTTALKSPETGFGHSGRLVSYAGTGVGLITEVKSAAQIVEEIRRDCVKVFEQMQQRTSTWKNGKVGY